MMMVWNDNFTDEEAQRINLALVLVMIKKERGHLELVLPNKNHAFLLLKYILYALSQYSQFLVHSFSR